MLLSSSYLRRVARRTVALFPLVLLLSLVASANVFAGDPVGDVTLQGSDPASSEALTFVWIILAGVLVFWMQAGFAILEAGFVKAKNTINILTKGYMDFCMGALGYFVLGYAIMYGVSFAGIVGTDGFLLLGDYYDVTHARDWFFQMVFAAAAATIVSGAMAERTKLSAYLFYSILLTSLIYPISGHWVWGGGWLSSLGFHDFAGSGVVHAVGGLLALVGAYMVGPRPGKFASDGTPRPMKPHNIPFIVLGGYILFMGWFGFNAGSTLNGNDLRMAVIVTNTFLAGAAGAVTCMFWGLRKDGTADVLKSVNGSLAGLVMVTAPCAVIAPWGAVVIGLFAGVFVLWAEGFVEKRLKVDDPVSAVAVHGACGLMGVLMVGIFADGTYGVSGLIVGNVTQLGIQALGAAAIAAWALGAGFVMFSLIKATVGLRAHPEELETGLDISEHGAEAYELGN